MDPATLRRFGAVCPADLVRRSKAESRARNLPAPMPLITDTIDLWLPPRIVEALHAHGKQLRVPHEVDGSRGQFRAPRTACLLKASSDYEARLNAA